MLLISYAAECMFLVKHYMLRMGVSSNGTERASRLRCRYTHFVSRSGLQPVCLCHLVYQLLVGPFILNAS